MSTTFSSRRAQDAAQGVTIIEVSGGLTLGAACDEFREWVDRALAEDCAGVIINLAGVDYTDSAGIGHLIGSLRSARSRGIPLKLLKVPARLLGLLQMTEVLPLFECFADETEALASFNEP